MSIRVVIASPCEESWESMQGDARVRACARCKLNVFDVKELSEQELRKLFVKTDGELCGRVYQRADGTVLTSDCPTGLARLRRKALAAFVLVATMLVAVIGFRFDAERSCAPRDESSWFTRLFLRRCIDARETLRETQTLGPLINELFPRAPMPTMGRMHTIEVLRPPSP